MANALTLLTITGQQTSITSVSITVSHLPDDSLVTQFQSFTT